MKFNKINYDSPEQATLKDCPFCQCEINVVEVPDDRYIKDGKCWVGECKNMGCILPRLGFYRVKEDFIKAWNQRITHE